MHQQIRVLPNQARGIDPLAQFLIRRVAACGLAPFPGFGGVIAVFNHHFDLPVA